MDELDPETIRKKLDLARKLLAKAEDPACVDFERDLFQRKAMNLIAEYGLDAAMIAAGLKAEARPTVADRTITVPAPFSTTKVSLLNAIAREMSVRVVAFGSLSVAAEKHPVVCEMVGFDADIDRCELLFTSLLVQSAYTLAATRMPVYEQPEPFRRSYFYGYGKAVGQRLAEANERARAARGDTGESMALVLADRGDQVARRYRERHPDVKRGPRDLAARHQRRELRLQPRSPGRPRRGPAGQHGRPRGDRRVTGEQAGARPPPVQQPASHTPDIGGVTPQVSQRRGDRPCLRTGALSPVNGRPWYVVLSQNGPPHRQPI